MIGRRYDDHVRRESVDVQEERAHDSLDFSGLVFVAAFFADRIELVEEYDAATRPDIFHQTSQADGGFAQIAPDNSVISDHEQRQRELACNGFSERGLSVPRGPSEQDPVSWLETVRAQKVRAVLFLHELVHGSGGRVRQDDVSQDSLRSAFVERTDGRVSARAAVPRRTGAQVLSKSIGDHMVLAFALFRDHGLNRATEANLVPLGASAHEVQQEVGPGHSARSMTRERPACQRGRHVGERGDASSDLCGN
jgi:hypothetical protein